MNYIKTMRIIGFKKFKDTKINFNEHIFTLEDAK